MADFTPVGADIKPPAATSLADMVNMARGIQAYQQAGQINPLLLQQQQLATQKAAATLQPDIETALAQARSAGASADVNEFQRNQHYLNSSIGVFGGLLTDPDFNPQTPNSDEMVKKLQAAKNYLINDLKIPQHKDSGTDKIIELAKSDPVAAIQYMRNGIQQVSGIATQAGQLNQAPTYGNVATPAGTVATPFNVSPYQQGVKPTAPAYQPGLAPSEQYPIVYNPTTNAPTFVPKNAYGVPMVGASQPAFAQMPESSQTRQDLMGYRENIQKASQNVPVINDSLNQIKTLASQIAKGKPGQLESSLAKTVGYVAGGDAATNNQRLGHYLALTSSQLANQMGLNGSDAGRAQADQLIGKEDWTPEALRSTASTVQAYNTGLELQNRGLEAVLKNNPSADIFPARDFRNAWSQNFNVDAMRLYNARMAGGLEGKMEYDQAVREMGGKDSPQFKRAMQSLGNLKMLVNGQIPPSSLPAPPQ